MAWKFAPTNFTKRKSEEIETKFGLIYISNDLDFIPELLEEIENARNAWINKRPHKIVLVYPGPSTLEEILQKIYDRYLNLDVERFLHKLLACTGEIGRLYEFEIDEDLLIQASNLFHDLLEAWLRSVSARFGGN